MSKFDLLFKQSEKISDTEFRCSSLKRNGLIIPKGVKVFDEDTSTWYIGNGSTLGGVELADTQGGAIVGNLTGSVTGNVSGDVTGNLTGVVIGSLIGNTYIEPIAAGTIPAYRLVEINSSAEFVVGTMDSLTVVGANKQNQQKVASDVVQVAQGLTSVVTASPVKAGVKIKCAGSGKVTQLITASVAGSTIGTISAGFAFANQPANDGVTLVSSEAADTTQVVTIIGTTHGGTVVVTEDVTLNGVTPVNSVKTNWGVILALKLSAQTAGTLTLTETSGGLTIIAASGGVGTVAIGVTAVSAASQGSFGGVPTMVADGATTKVVGIKTVTNGGTVAYEAKALNGTTPVDFVGNAMLVTELYGGDVENNRLVTVNVGAQESYEKCVGKSLTAATAADTTISAILAV